MVLDERRKQGWSQRLVDYDSLSEFEILGHFSPSSTNARRKLIGVHRKETLTENNSKKHTQAKIHYKMYINFRFVKSS